MNNMYKYVLKKEFHRDRKMREIYGIDYPENIKWSLRNIGNDDCSAKRIPDWYTTDVDQDDAEMYTEPRYNRRIEKTKQDSSGTADVFTTEELEESLFFTHDPNGPPVMDRKIIDQRINCLKQYLTVVDRVKPVPDETVHQYPNKTSEQSYSMDEKFVPKSQTSLPIMNPQYKEAGKNEKVYVNEISGKKDLKEKLTNLPNHQFKAGNVKQAKQYEFCKNDGSTSISDTIYGQSRFRFSLLHAFSHIPCRIPVLVPSQKETGRHENLKTPNTSRKRLDRDTNTAGITRRQVISNNRTSIRNQRYTRKTSEKVKSAPAVIPGSRVTVRTMPKYQRNMNTNTQKHRGRDTVIVKSQTEKKNQAKSRIPRRIIGYVWNAMSEWAYRERRKENEARRMLFPASKIPVFMGRIRRVKDENQKYKRQKEFGFRSTLPSIQNKDINVITTKASVRSKIMLLLPTINNQIVSHELPQRCLKKENMDYLPKSTSSRSSILGTSPLPPIVRKKEGSHSSKSELFKPGTSVQLSSRFSPLPPAKKSKEIPDNFRRSKSALRRFH